MNLALTKNDIRVLIGGKVCPIIDLEDDEVTCQIPDLADAVKDPLGYKVEVSKARFILPDVISISKLQIRNK